MDKNSHKNKNYRWEKIQIKKLWGAIFQVAIFLWGNFPRATFPGAFFLEPSQGKRTSQENLNIRDKSIYKNQ